MKAVPKRPRGVILPIVIVVVVIFVMIIALSVIMSRREFQSPPRRSEQTLRPTDPLEIFDANMDKIPFEDAVRAVKKEVDKLQEPVARLADQLAHMLEVNEQAAHKEGVLDQIAANKLREAAKSLEAHERLAHHPIMRGRHGDSIFVSLVSRNPDLCRTTLHSLFSNATAPTRVHVALLDYNSELAQQAAAGIDDVNKTLPTHSCLQNELADCAITSSFCPSDQIRSRILPTSADTGDATARALLQKLFRNEEFVMYIDNGVMFSKGWDTAIVRHHEKLKKGGALPNPLPIISFDPAFATSGAGIVRDDGLLQAFKLCRVEKSPYGVPLIGEKGAAATLEESNLAAVQQHFITTSFLFAPATFITRMRMDPSLKHIPREVDDLMLSARAWTNGFASFAPIKVEEFVFAFVGTANATSITNETSEVVAQQRRDSVTTAKLLLGSPLDSIESSLPPSALDTLKASVARFGLGSKRSMKQYLHVTGIDLKKQKSSKDLCALSKEIK